MKTQCAECGEEIPYRNINTQTRFIDDEFRTVYRCPKCGTELSDFTAL
jgi:DNA-directed RNA polymerase subunit RPC12/RpoP